MDAMNYNPIVIDDNKLLSIGFNQIEIQNLHYLINNGAKFTSTALQSYGYNYEQAKRLMYAYNICAGKVQVDSKEEMVRHLKKMFGGNYKISIQDLAVSKLTSVPRVAVVANLTQEPYTIWNSKNYKGMASLYKVVDVTGQRITIETSRKPRLEYKQAKVIPGVLEIKGVRANGNAVVSFDKKYCALCNRFVIVASLRNPEFHLGKFEMICFEGTRVYVYATNMGVREQVKYSMGNQRIYDFGIFPEDIKGKLSNIAKGLYNHLKCASAQYFDPNMQYKIVEVNSTIDDSEDIDL